MLTPILNAQPDTPNARYTSEHTSTRSMVERTFGMVTKKWFGVNRARKLYYTPEKVTKIVIAAFIIHNFRRANG